MILHQKKAAFYSIILVHYLFTSPSKDVLYVLDFSQEREFVKQKEDNKKICHRKDNLSLVRRSLSGKGKICRELGRKEEECH